MLSGQIEPNSLTCFLRHQRGNPNPNPNPSPNPNSICVTINASTHHVQGTKNGDLNLESLGQRLCDLSRGLNPNPNSNPNPKPNPNPNPNPNPRVHYP